VIEEVVVVVEVSLVAGDGGGMFTTEISGGEDERDLETELARLEVEDDPRIPLAICITGDSGP